MKALLARFLPLDKVIALAMRFGLLQKPLQAAAKAWNGAQGVRTQSCMVMAGATAIAAALGYVPWSAATPLIAAFAGAAGPAFADKVNRYLPEAQKVAEAVAAEAAKTPDAPKA